MNFESRERLTDVMQTTFLSMQESSGEPSGMRHEDDPLFFIYARTRLFQATYEETLASLDWEYVESQMDTRYMDDPDGDNEVSAHGHVRTLIGAAFEDAQLLMAHSLNVLPEKIREDKQSVAEILRKSRNTLLQIALIGEEEHRKIIDNSGATTPVEFDGGSIRWTSDAQSEILQHRMTQKEGRGCPAHFRTIDHRGSRTTLLNAFWDSLISYVFEEDTNSAQTLESTHKSNGVGH